MSDNNLSSEKKAATAVKAWRRDPQSYTGGYTDGLLEAHADTIIAALERAQPETPETHLHCCGCDGFPCKGLPVAAQPPKEPTPEWILKARTEGRAEFLTILLGSSAEEFCQGNEYIGEHAIADTGDYGCHWNENELRELFQVDAEKFSYVQNIEGVYWSQQHEIDSLKERAAPPPNND